MKNFLTFDLESWYDSEFVLEKNHPDFVIEGLRKVLSLLNKHKVKATFFITGDVLLKYPEEVKKLHLTGHEIASHSFKHTMLNKMSKEDIKNNILLSSNLIKKITGQLPLGFRAPSWSISKKEFWVYNFLSDQGFKYSSSLFPINMGLYGSSAFPVEPFNPLQGKHFLEFPIRPLEILTIRIPFAGGVYFRLLPKNIISLFIKKTNKKNKPVIIYFHPWEFCPNLPKVKTSLVGKITTYHGLKRNINKLDYLLSNFRFFPLKTAIKNDQY